MAIEGRPGQPAAERQPAALLEARRADDPAAPAADVTYTVLMPARPPHGGRVERRGDTRQRTRLRSGKIVDIAGRFLVECTVYDLSSSGGRIRYPTGFTTPGQFQLFDDRSGVVHHATVLWTRGNECGVAFKRQPLSPRAGALASEMRRKFYAIRH